MHGVFCFWLKGRSWFNCQDDMICSKRIKSYLAVSLIIAVAGCLLVSCADSSEKTHQLDAINASYLNLFLEQEEHWAMSVSRMDSLEALAALDSMRVIEEKFAEDTWGLTPAPMDTSYFHSVNALWEGIQLLTDSLLPRITTIAMLPRVEYTRSKEKKLHEYLNKADSLMTVRLEEFKLERAAFFGRTGAEPEY